MTLQSEMTTILMAGARTLDDLLDLYSDSTEAEIQDALTALLEMDPPQIELSDGVYQGK